MDRFAGLIGIDLGTTMCCVAHLSRDGVPTTIPNREGDLLTPSVVQIDDIGIIVGREAKRTECLAPDRTAVCVKRDMGQRFYSRLLANRQYHPELLSAMILKRLREDAEARLGAVKNAVITVPAYFDDLHRKATQDAGRIAGLKVLDIINEPTAAALAFTFAAHVRQTGTAKTFDAFTERPTTALVFDLGGGTFDVSLVRISADRFETLGTDGDVRLGGRDWDQRIVEWAADKFSQEYGDDPLNDPESLAMLYQQAEQAKHALTLRMSTRMMVVHGGRRLAVELTRLQFQQLTADLLMRTRTTTELVVESAGLTFGSIDTVLLVGGMTRIPIIRDMLREISGLVPDASLAADEVVAHGAAVHGGILLSRGLSAEDAPELARWNTFTTIDVNAHSLGVAVRTVDGEYANSILIPKNTPLPHTCSKAFRTHSPNQSQVKIRVLQGEASEAKACLQVGECILDDLPPNLPAHSLIEVFCTYSSDGRIEIAGREPESGREVATTLVRPCGMSEDEVRQAVESLSVTPVG